MFVDLATKYLAQFRQREVDSAVDALVLQFARELAADIRIR